MVAMGSLIYGWKCPFLIKKYATSAEFFAQEGPHIAKFFFVEIGAQLENPSFTTPCSPSLCPETKLQEHHKERDFEALDNLITSLTFAPRDPEFIAEAPETKATNVLNYVNRLSRKIQPLHKHYDPV